MVTNATKAPKKKAEKKKSEKEASKSRQFRGIPRAEVDLRSSSVATRQSRCEHRSVLAAPSVATRSRWLRSTASYSSHRASGRNAGKVCHNGHRLLRVLHSASAHTNSDWLRQAILLSPFCCQHTPQPHFCLKHQP